MRTALLTCMKLLAVSMLVLFVVSLLVYFFVPDYESIARVNESIEEISALLMFGRILVFVVVWLYWTAILDFCFPNNTSKALAYFKTRRNFYLFVFLAIEILLIQNVLSTFWR